MSTPLNLGIQYDQGSDFNLTIVISDDNGPLDITGYQFKGEMRETSSSASPVVAEFQFSIQNQTTNKGQVTWFLSATNGDEANIATSIANANELARQTTPYMFDVKMKDLGGTVSRIIQGIIYVSPEVTQETF